MAKRKMPKRTNNDLLSTSKKIYSPRIQITNRILQKNYWNWR